MDTEGMKMMKHFSMSESSSLSVWLLQCKCMLCATACAPGLFYKELRGE